MSTPRQRLLIGTYTEGFDTAAGDGILLLEFDPENGSLQRLACCGDVVNPSYLARDPAAANRFYAISENFSGAGAVAHFEITGGGRIRLLARQTSPGDSNCHLCLHAGFACVASYGDGWLNVHPLDQHGSPGAHVRQFRYEGSSVHPRQDMPRAHQAVPSPAGDALYVCDLGSDIVWRHALAPDGPAEAAAALRTPPGTGPRHLCFHPQRDLVYILCELSNELLVARRDPGTGALEITGRHAGPDRLQQPAAAAIKMHPSHRLLAASYRGNVNEVGLFRLGEDGMPGEAAFIPTGGENPRDIAIDATGRWLLAAHQTSNTITVLRLDEKTPDAELVHSVEYGTPVCILPL